MRNQFYAGQYNPNSLNDLQKLLDDQNAIMVAQEREIEQKTLPKRLLILGGGILVIIATLIIIKR